MVNYGLWVIMMCQCRFVFGKKCSTVRQMCAGVYGKSLYLPFNFVVDLNLLEKVVFKNKIN